MNAYEWCISQGILRVHMVGSTRMMQLTPEYQFAPEDSALSTNPVSRSTSSDAPAAAHPSSAGSTPQVVPSLTKRHTSLDRASSSFHASSSSAASNNVPRKSLRDLVMRVGRFRKIRLVATDSSKSLLEAFVDDLCATADQTPAVMTTPVAVAATTAAANVQKLLKSRL
jgi:hypothetical protein